MPPERRLEENKKIRERLDEIQQAYEHWAHRTQMILMVIAIGLGFAGVATIYLFDQNNHRVDDIQDSRKELCEDQNARNDNTEDTLDNVLGGRYGVDLSPTESAEERREVLREAGVQEATIERLEDTRAFTLLLVATIVPKRNCEALVED